MARSSLNAKFCLSSQLSRCVINCFPPPPPSTQLSRQFCMMPEFCILLHENITRRLNSLISVLCTAGVSDQQTSSTRQKRKIIKLLYFFNSSINPQLSLYLSTYLSIHLLRKTIHLSTPLTLCIRVLV